MSNCLHCFKEVPSASPYKQFCSHAHLRLYTTTETPIDELREIGRSVLFGKEEQTEDLRKELSIAQKEIVRLNAIINRLL